MAVEEITKNYNTFLDPGGINYVVIVGPTVHSVKCLRCSRDFRRFREDQWAVKRSLPRDNFANTRYLETLLLSSGLLSARLGMVFHMHQPYSTNAPKLWCVVRGVVAAAILAVSRRVVNADGSCSRKLSSSAIEAY